MNDTGIVNAYNDFKGFGFIRREKGKVLAIGDNLRTDIKGANNLNIDSIFIGLNVKFDVEKTKKGPRALNIRQL